MDKRRLAIVIHFARKGEELSKERASQQSSKRTEPVVIHRAASNLDTAPRVA